MLSTSTFKGTFKKNVSKGHKLGQGQVKGRNRLFFVLSAIETGLMTAAKCEPKFCQKAPHGMEKVADSYVPDAKKSLSLESRQARFESCRVKSGHQTKLLHERRATHVLLVI